MVVLEGGGMLATGSNQYLQPDYLSPLPTTLDAKKSPLALLAQTCSQIGADSPPSKPLIPPLEKPKKSSGSNSNSSSSSGAAPDSSPAPDAKAAPADKPPRASPAEPRLAFKPYEANVLTKKLPDERPPSSKSGAGADDEKKPSSRAPSRKSATPTAVSGSAPTPTPAADAKAERGKSASPAGTGGASPIIRSGLEILQGHPKDLPLGTYKGPLSAGLGGALGGSLGALCSGCPPGLEAGNPAFRPPFAGAAGPFAHHQAMLAASGYPGASPGPYVSYARVKTAAGGETLVPVCKDPYCTGCQYSAAHQHLPLAAAACPSGCTQCDHQKYVAAGLSLLGHMQSGSGVPPPPPLSYSHQLGRPYVCNWIAGDSYCGKRFSSSDELLQHLRTHTSLGAAADSAAAAAAAAAVSSAGPMSSLLNPHSFLGGGLHRAGYPNPPLSPLSAAAAARYHPYSKPGGALPPSLAASPFSAFNPTALGPYYSPYSIYGQRIGAAVHP